MARISVTHAAVPGSEIERVVEGPSIDITNTEVLALQTTPKTLLTARAGFIHSLRAWYSARQQGHMVGPPPPTYWKSATPTAAEHGLHRFQLTVS